MIIKEIKLEHFKSIYDPTTIRFDKPGLWKVGGPVGSGKTTLGEAILFCLYGQVKNKTIGDLISWGATRCVAEVEMTTGGHDIHLRRLVKRQGQGQLDITIDGEPLEYTDKRAGQQILESEYYDVPRVAVESLCIISFNNFKSIASMGPGSKESRQFIDDVFGFGVVSKYIDQTKAIRDEKREGLLQLEARKQVMEKEICGLQKKITESQTAGDDQEMAILSSEISRRSAELAADGQEKNRMLGEYRQMYGDADAVCVSLKNQGKQLRKNIDLVRGGVCPVCGGEVSEEKLTGFTKELDDLRERYKEAELLRNRRLDEMNTFADAWRHEYPKRVNNIDDMKRRLREMQLKREYEAAGNEARISTLQSDIQAVKRDLTSAELDLSSWNDLYDELYKNSRGVLMRYYVDELNDNINYYLQEMQQPYVVKFSDRFECVISAFGEESIGINTLSTGQEKVVNTAIIFGILKTLLNGVNFNIIFLDELTSNMHDDLRDLTCDMIRRNITGKSIYIISHAPIDEQLFDGEIKVKLYPREEDGRLIQSSVYTVESQTV